MLCILREPASLPAARKTAKGQRFTAPTSAWISAFAWLLERGLKPGAIFDLRAELEHEEHQRLMKAFKKAATARAH